MSAIDDAFKAELFALMAKHKASIKWDPVYYPGETEDMRFDVEGGTRFLDIKDLQQEFEAAQINNARQGIQFP